jgi:hypothetical protein
MMRACVLIAMMLVAAGTDAARAADAPIQLDPFARATHGDASCPEVAPPLLDAAEARSQAHARVERGLRCAMEGTCAPGGSYRQDPQINAAVAAAIDADARFADTSVWITTSRHWVTLQGCVRSSAQHRRLVEFVKRQPNVERVFDELRRSPGLRDPSATGRPIR